MTVAAEMHMSIWVYVYCQEVCDTVFLLCYSLAWHIYSVLFFKVDLDNVTFSFLWEA